MTLITGMRADLWCRFESDLAPTVHWLRDNTDVTGRPVDGRSKDSFRKVKDANGFDHVGERLTFESVSPEDSGLYYCVGKTNSGKTPGIIKLTVLSEAEAILEPPTNVTVTEGETAVLNCRTRLEVSILKEFMLSSVAD